MGEQVTDPALLAQLNASGPAAPRQVTDPALLAQLNAPDTANAPPDASLADIGRTYLSAAMRPILNAVGGIPEMAANAGVGLRNVSENAVNRFAPNFAQAIYALNRNLAGDSQVLQALLPQGAGEHNQYGSFSSYYRPQIDAAFAPPETKLGRLAEAVSSGIAGGAIPGPQVAKLAPAEFTRAITAPRDMALQGAQNAGYVVPPSTTNPTVTNKVLESMAGKIATEQDARLANQGVTDALARKAVGLAEDEAITPDALRGIRAVAAQANKAIRNTGTITTDEKFTEGVADVLSKYKSAGGVSDKLAQTQVQEIADSFKKSFPASDAVDAIQVLRDRAASAYAKGEPEVGKGLRSLSKVLEDQVERHLQDLGEDGASLLQKFREGRQLMAKTFTIEKSLNPETGSVSAVKLARELAKGRPLSGELAQAARFGSAFPKVAAPVMDSGSVRNTDVALGAIAAIADKHPQWLLYPFARMGVRAGLLSRAGQSLAVPYMGDGVPPGLLTGLPGVEESLAQQ